MDKVAVVGAGLAGLTAAYDLTLKGLDVVVFEARSRVGGRVFTTTIEDSCKSPVLFEMGGLNIADGGVAEHSMGLISKLGLNIQKQFIKTDFIVADKTQQFRYGDLASCFKENDILSVAKKVNNIADLVNSLPFHPLLKMAVLTQMEAYEGVPVHLQSIYHNIDTLMSMLSGTISNAHKSYKHEEDEVMISSIQGGNARLPLALANILGSKVCLNTVLKQLNIGKNGVTLVFEDGSSHFFKRVILAIPASLFKDISFVGLDKNRLDGIQNIKYGSNQKIALPLNMDDPSFIIAKDVVFCNMNIGLPFVYCNKNIKELSKSLRYIARGLGISQNYFACPIQNVSPHLFVLHKQGFYTHDWAQDRFSRGSYSGYSIDSAKALQETTVHNTILYKSSFAPIEDKLFFAGEHTTILEYIGTMEAAIESGYRVSAGVMASFFPH